MRSWMGTSLLALIATLAGAASAEAAAIPVSTLFKDFTVITDHDLLVTGADIEGPILVGRDLSTGGILNFPDPKPVIPLPIPIAGYGEVNVFRNVLAGTNAIVEGSVTLIGGANHGMFSNTGAGSVLAGYTFPGSGPGNAGTFATDIWAQVTGFSATLTAKQANSVFTAATGVFAASAVNGVAVWDINAAELGSKSLSFTGLASNDVGIVNVNGDLKSSAALFSDATELPNVIFNFGNATNVALGGGFWDASILAPNATVTSSVDVAGTVVADIYAASAETHASGFTCGANICDAPVRVPEPGSLSVLGGALVALAAIHRRRRT